MPKLEELPNLLNREAEVPRPADEAERVDIPLVIVAVSGFPPGCARDEADFLIVADHPLGHAGRLCRFADLHSLTPLRRSELPITATELNAIAAPAMIGESKIPNEG